MAEPTETVKTDTSGNGVLWVNSANNLLSTIGSIWTSTNDVKLQKNKISSLQEELKLLQEANDGKEIDVKLKQIELEEIKLKEATKLQGYGYILKAITGVGLIIVLLSLIRSKPQPQLQPQPIQQWQR